MVYLHNDREQFREAIYLSYQQTGIMAQAIEKDYYVTLLLQILAQEMLTFLLLRCASPYMRMPFQ